MDSGTAMIVQLLALQIFFFTDERPQFRTTTKVEGAYAQHRMGQQSSKKCQYYIDCAVHYFYEYPCSDQPPNVFNVH